MKRRLSGINNYFYPAITRSAKTTIDRSGSTSCLRKRADANTMLWLSQLGAEGLAKELNSNPELQVVEHAKILDRQGVKEPLWQAIRRRLSFINPRRWHIVSGRPFKNINTLSQENKPDRVLVEVSGFGSGSKNIFGGKPLSGLVTAGVGIPENELLQYQYTDKGEATEALNLLRLAGIKHALLGHSFGGGTAIDIAKTMPDEHVSVIDPVKGSILNKQVPENVSTYLPNDKTTGLENIVALMGQRFTVPPGRQYYTYNGRHISGTAYPAAHVYLTQLTDTPDKVVEDVTKVTKHEADNDSGNKEPAQQAVIDTKKPMNKQGSNFSDWAKMVSNDILHYNPPSNKKTVGNAFAGATGLILATYVKNRIQRKKTRARDLVLAAIAGATGGTAFSYYRSYMDGKPFDNSGFDIKSIKPGETVYLGIAGSANGEGNSWFGNELRRQGPRGHVKMFRHVDTKDLEKTYKELKDIGAVPVIVGHSSGGKHAAKFLEKHPDAKGYLLDPVSWFGKTHPRNATAFTVDKRTRHGLPIENYIADAGGRWNINDAGTYIHTGSHSDTMPKIIRDFILQGYDRGNVPSVLPDYITGRMWDPK